MAMRRQSRERDIVPFGSEDIEVFWETDPSDTLASTVWWRAHVIEISDDHRPGVLVLEKIVYVKLGKHDSCEHDVEFLPGRVLRRAEPEGEENNNPEMSWQTAPEGLPEFCGVEQHDSDWDVDADAPPMKRRNLGLIKPTGRAVHILGKQLVKMRRTHASLLLEMMMIRRQVIANTGKLQGRECNTDTGTIGPWHI